MSNDGAEYDYDNRQKESDIGAYNEFYHPPVLATQCPPRRPYHNGHVTERNGNDLQFLPNTMMENTYYRGSYMCDEETNQMIDEFQTEATYSHDKHDNLYARSRQSPKPNASSLLISRIPSSSADHRNIVSGALKIAPTLEERKPNSSVVSPPIKPTRPLSAYNIFFKEERIRILASSKGEEIRESGTLDHCGENNSIKEFTKSSNYVNETICSISTELSPETNPHKKKRGRPRGTNFKLRPTPHRKIEFQKMGKLIGARWKSIGQDTKSSYLAKALKEKQRYERKKKEYLDQKNIYENQKKKSPTLKHSCDKTVDDEGAQERVEGAQGKMYDYNHYNGTPDHSFYATKMKKQQCQNRTTISKKSEPCSSKPGPSEIYHNGRVPSPLQHPSQLPASYLPYYSQNCHPPAPTLVFQHPPPKNYQPHTFMNYPLPFPSDYHQHISPHHQSLDSSSYNPPNPHMFPSNINPESICMQPPPYFADYTHDLQLNCAQKSSINNHALSTSKNETSHQIFPSNHMPWCSSNSYVLDPSNNQSSPSNYVSQQIFSRNGKELSSHAQEASNMEDNQCIDNYPPHY